MLRFGIGPRLIDSIMWMIGLQLVAGCVFLAWSVARLRRVSRRLAEAGGGKRGLSRFWPAPSPAIVEAPARVVRTRFSGKSFIPAQAPGFAEVLGALVAMGVVGLIGFGTYHFGRPAFIELSQNGYGS